jgi:hypothetical protein
MYLSYYLFTSINLPDFAFTAICRGFALQFHRLSKFLLSQERHCTLPAFILFATARNTVPDRVVTRFKSGFFY